MSQTTATPTRTRKAFLEVLMGTDRSCHAIETDRATLGLHEFNDIPLDAEGLSCFHAEIVATDGGWVLRDLGSTNGSFVNGRRIALATLESGDRIVLGRVLLRFSDGPPVPPARRALQAAAAIALALVLGSFVQSLTGGRPAEADAALTEAEREARYLSLMDEGLERFRWRDFESSRQRFLDARRLGVDDGAPEVMLDLCDLFEGSDDPATLPWDRLEEALAALQEDLPATPSYEAFAREELRLLDLDRRCGRHLRILVLPGASAEERFGALDEAGRRWPESRIYQAYADRIVPLAAGLLAQRTEDGDRLLAEAHDRVEREEWTEARAAFAAAGDRFEEARRFDLEGVNRELDERIERAAADGDACDLLLAGIAHESAGRPEEATRTLLLVPIGTACYTPARHRIATIRFDEMAREIEGLYRGGRIEEALERIALVLRSAPRDRRALRAIVRLEVRISRVERAYQSLRHAAESGEHRTALDRARTILEIEGTAPSGNFFVGEARRAESAARQALSELHAEACRRLTRAVEDGRYADVLVLVDEARRHQIDPDASETDDLLRTLLEARADALVRDLARLTMTGGQRTDPDAYRNLRFANQLIVDRLADDPSRADAVARARRNMAR